MSKCLWILWFNILIIKIYSEKIILYKHNDSELYSNSSFTEVHWKSMLFLFWIDMSIQSVYCVSPCKVEIDDSLQMAKINFNLNDCDIFQTHEISLIYLDQLQMKLFKVNVSFQEFPNKMLFNCMPSYFIYQKNKYEFPYCTMIWCSNIQCQNYRKINYNYKLKFYTIKGKQANGVLVNKNMRNFSTLVKLNVLNNNNITIYESPNFILAILSRIDTVDYQCSYINNLIIQPLNSATPHLANCMMSNKVPYYDSLIVLTIDNINYRNFKVYFQLPSKFDGKMYKKPFYKSIIHRISYLTKSGVKSYILRNDSFIYYTKNSKSICEHNNKTKDFLNISYDSCIDCSFNGTQNQYFQLYLTFVGYSQPRDSFYTKDLLFCPKKNWRFNVKTHIKGFILLKNTNRSDVKINNVIAPIELKVIVEDELSSKSLKFKNEIILKSEEYYVDILPHIVSMNLPSKLTFVCTVDRVNISISINNLINHTLYQCDSTFVIPIMNVNNITVIATFHFIKGAMVINRTYSIGRFPSIFKVDTVTPSLGQPLFCYTDDQLYPITTDWSCLTFNKERDWMPEDLFSSINNSLKFLLTAPLTKISCFCSMNFSVDNITTLYSINASVEFDLSVNNELKNCEIPMIFYYKVDWGVNFCNLAIFVLLLSSFLLTAFLMTDGVFKNSMQIELLNKLGVNKGWTNDSMILIPRIVIRRDDGEQRYERIVKLVYEAEQRVDRIRFLNNPTLEKAKHMFGLVNLEGKHRFKLNSEERIKSAIIHNQDDKRTEILKELKRRDHLKMEARKAQPLQDRSKANREWMEIMQGKRPGPIKNITDAIQEVSEKESFKNLKQKATALKKGPQKLRRSNSIPKINKLQWSKDHQDKQKEDDISNFNKKFTVAISDMGYKNTRHSLRRQQPKRTITEMEKDRTMERMFAMLKDDYKIKDLRKLSSASKDIRNSSIALKDIKNSNIVLQKEKRDSNPPTYKPFERSDDSTETSKNDKLKVNPATKLFPNIETVKLIPITENEDSAYSLSATVISLSSDLSYLYDDN